MNEIRSKWESLLHSRPNLKGLVGRAELVGGHMIYNDDRDEVLKFITNKGSFTYNARTGEFKITFQVC